MGDFVTIGVMGGQQIASVGKIIQVQTSYLQFPLAAANAVILLSAVVLMMIWGLTRLVDILNEAARSCEKSRNNSTEIIHNPLPNRAPTDQNHAKRASGLWPLFFALFVLFFYGPDDHHLCAELSGALRAA